MPPNRQESEPERLTALETHMSNVLGILAKREEYQASVLVKLTQIEMKQDQALSYQKTCDGERAAHGQRIGSIENSLALLKGTVAGVSAIVSIIFSLATAWVAGRH